MEMVIDIRLHTCRKFRVNVSGKTPGNVTTALAMKFIHYEVRFEYKGFLQSDLLLDS